jgi:hypothetical protein
MAREDSEKEGRKKRRRKKKGRTYPGHLRGEWKREWVGAKEKAGESKREWRTSRTSERLR